MSEYPEIGGLISYGTNITEANRQVGILCRRNPQGREARRLAGCAVIEVRAGHQSPDCKNAGPYGPPRVFARADEVIE